MDTSSPMLFTGNAHRALAEDVAHRLGMPLGKALVGTFSDGEVQIEIEENVFAAAMDEVDPSVLQLARECVRCRIGREPSTQECRLCYAASADEFVERAGNEFYFG